MHNFPITFYFVVSILLIIIFSTTTYTQRGQTAVYYASAEGHSEVVKLLVQAGADLELHTEVHTLWDRLILALAVCDIVAWDKAGFVPD